MKNNIKFISLWIIFSFIGCKTSPQFIPPRGYENLPIPFQSDTIYAWKVDTVCSAEDIVYYEFPPIEDIKNLSEIKKTFYNKSGVLLHKELNNSDYAIALAMSSETNIIKMRGKIPYNTSISKYGVTDWSEILYDELGNIWKKRIN